MQNIKKWKLALLVWFIMFPTITILSILLNQINANIPLILRTLIMSGILVPFMVFLVIPNLNKYFKNWLSK
jgi:antibiotic biosynthesis monooxygenase (ABM) superfamily enzyme